MAGRTGIEAQGDLGEAAHVDRLEKSGASPVNLNVASERNNFPLVDVASKEGFDSVKGYGDAQAAVDHLLELQAPPDWASSKTLAARAQAAKAIVAIREKLQASGAWPDALERKAGAEKIGRHLADKGRVAVPEDKVQEAQGLLEKEVGESPGPWGVDAKATDFAKAVAQRVGELKARIVGCGATAAELVEHAEQSVRPSPGAGHGAASNLERLAAPQPEPASAASSAAPEPAGSASQSAAGASQAGAAPAPHAPGAGAANVSGGFLR